MAVSNSFIQIFLICNFFLISQSIDHFIFHGFNHSNLAREGATVIKPSGALRLTNNSHNVIGLAFFPTKIPMQKNSSFSTNFVFQIYPSAFNRGGYGLAFALSPSPTLPGADAGHFLGVFNKFNDGNSSNHVFMVEFDTVDGHNESSDSDGNHVGININGMNSNATEYAAYYVDGTQAKKEDIDLHKDGPIQVWIDYDGTNKVINVTVAPLNIPKPNRPLLFEVIDLSSVFLEEMYVGFSSAAGRKSSSHYILGWSFRLNGIADQLNQSLLPIVLAEKMSSSNGKVRIALISTFSLLLFIMVASLISIVFYRRVMKYEVLEDWEFNSPHRFRYRDLYKATKGFNDSKKIGVGGFGSVYRGVLPSNGVEVAVKKIMSNNPLQGMREFAAEIESLGRLRHKNLVHLQGWCKNKNNLLLVYDYVANGSLDSLLYNPRNGLFLNWDQRFNIIKGVASGLLYLHEEWEQVVIHRDIKSSNVLIDRDMNPRLGDFGLARLYDHGKNSHTTNVVGTIGYIAPELTRTGKASTSSDVFAYGILLLEIACGRAPVVYEAHRNVILVDWVAERLQMGRILDVVDVGLGSVYVVEEMELILGLGLVCSHPNADARPSMRQVMKYLNGDETLPLVDGLSSAGSRRVDEITSRFLALGFTERISNTSRNTASSYRSSSAGAMSSFGSGS